MMNSFAFTGMPKLIFGCGEFKNLPQLVRVYGSRVLLVIGGKSLESSGNLGVLLDNFRINEIEASMVFIQGEPSPQAVDEAVSKFQGKNIQVVVAVGGGSVLDAGKAIAAMLPLGKSVKLFLEGVGTQIHSGTSLPMIAVPTTSGTGSEATKNAVLSEVGEQGYKKSLRHDNFIPKIAVLDPELCLSVPPKVTAACGMDAFTQLLESYTSTKANPMTDALALDGLKRVYQSLVPACTTESMSVEVRGNLAYGAFVSGVTLAHAGLGVVHGIASPMGAVADIPHGVVCGTLLAPATKVTLEALQRDPSTDKDVYLAKFASVGRLFHPEALDKEEACQVLVECLDQWTEELSMPLLRDYGIREKQVDAIVAGSSSKNNAEKLSREEIKRIILERL